MRKMAVAAVLAAVAAVALLGAAWWAGPATFTAWWEISRAWLVAHPLLLVFALVILTGVPVPSSALLVATGWVWQENPVMACAIAVGALTLNMMWTYAFAAGPGRRLVEWLLAHTKMELPILPRNDYLRLILVMRLTPGMPFFFQNYTLGLLRVPFRIYLPVSIACNAPVACGMVLGGAGLGTGGWLPLFVGTGLVVLAGVVAHSLLRWLRQRAAADRSGEEAALSASRSASDRDVDG